MELLVSLEEIKVIVTKELVSRGFKVKVEQAAFKKHVEGEYEDTREIIDGLAYRIEDLSV